MLCKVYNVSMDEKIFSLTDELKKEMDNDPRFLKLQEIEEKMNNDEEVMRLAYQKDLKSDRYNDLLKIYDDKHPLVVSARKELVEAKTNLESHPLVKEYLKAYAEVKMLLYKVNDILFGDFKGENI